MRIQHGHTHLKIHKLSEGEGTPLLLLHQVGGSAEDWIERAPQWPGPVHALDFSGHGASDFLNGGGYYPESYAAEADIAVGALGDRAIVAGMGVGAYAAFILAGARPGHIPAALLWPGRGLAGQGAEPDFVNPAYETIEEWDARVEADAKRYREGTDPLVSSCEHDLRPYDYVAAFAESANRILLPEGLLAPPAPEWLSHISKAKCMQTAPPDLSNALSALAQHADA